MEKINCLTSFHQLFFHNSSTFTSHFLSLNRFCFVSKPKPIPAVASAVCTCSLHKGFETSGGRSGACFCFRVSGVFPPDLSSETSRGRRDGADGGERTLHKNKQMDSNARTTPTNRNKLQKKNRHGGSSRHRSGAESTHERICNTQRPIVISTKRRKS